MACHMPITIKNERYNGFNQRNHKVPCGKCVGCLKARQNQWSFRLDQERKVSETSYFVTLTYNDHNLPYTEDGLATLYARDTQLFLKRLRKYCQKFTSNKLKYYLCGEYGSKTHRPHYHIILYNLPAELAVTDVNRVSEILGKIWKMGHVRIDPCNIKTIKYVAKYVMKRIKREQRIKDGIEPEFARMSKGLGLSYLSPAMTKFLKDRQQPFITLNDGVKQSMPRYFREKIFTIEDKFAMRFKANIHREMIMPFENGKQEFDWILDQERKVRKLELLKRSKL